MKDIVEIEIKNKTPEYTVYEIIQEISEELKKYKNLNEVSKIYNIELKILEEFLKSPKILSLDMYRAASKILKKTIKELTSSKEEVIKPSFRKKDKMDIQKIKYDINLADSIFNEIIINKRINK